MVLRPETASVQALNSQSGDVIGEWKLPQENDIKFMALAGGGASLFVVGHSRKLVGGVGHRRPQSVSIWHFPLPQELQRLQAVQTSAQVAVDHLTGFQDM